MRRCQRPVVEALDRCADVRVAMTALEWPWLEAERASKDPRRTGKPVANPRQKQG